MNSDRRRPRPRLRSRPVVVLESLIAFLEETSLPLLVEAVSSDGESTERDSRPRRRSMTVPGGGVPLRSLRRSPERRLFEELLVMDGSS